MHSSSYIIFIQLLHLTSNTVMSVNCPTPWTDMGCYSAALCWSDSSTTYVATDRRRSVLRRSICAPTHCREVSKLSFLRIFYLYLPYIHIVTHS